MLNEKEKIILANLLYLDESVQVSTVGELINMVKNDYGEIDTKLVGKLGISGGLNAEQCTEIFKMADECSADFKNLQVARTINQGGVRGICYANANDYENATVVFRGTGGLYDAWYDNFTSEYMLETPLQEIAGDFVKYDCAAYKNIETVGHSKGANFAAYAAIKNPDSVTLALMLDGQGENDAFVKEYADIIAANKDKIKSINADNDIVNTLLNDVAGEKYYIANDGHGIAGGHSSYNLLKNCRFDENGNVTGFVEQSKLMEKFDSFAQTLTKSMDSMPNNGNVVISKLFGTIAASALSNDVNELDKFCNITEAFDDTWNYVKENLFNVEEDNSVHIVIPETYVDISKMKMAAEELDNTIIELKLCEESLMELMKRCDFSFATEITLDVLLYNRIDSLTNLISMINVYRQKLNSIIDLYVMREMEVTALFV